jgi:methyltransferase family protein
VDLPSLLGSIDVTREYSELDLSGLETDLQGWGADRPVFERLLAEARPNVVIEVGVWKGASLIRMHGLARELGLSTQFIAIDTWLGSAEHWLGAKDRARLQLRGGYPDLYRQFVFNLLANDAGDVFALPMPSNAAARVLAELGVRADLIYVDAGHEEVDVRSDLASYLPLLTDLGVMFGDDYGPSWPGLVRAVDDFARKGDLELDGPVWILRPIARKADQAACGLNELSVRTSAAASARRIP